MEHTTPEARGRVPRHIPRSLASKIDAYLDQLGLFSPAENQLAAYWQPRNYFASTPAGRTAANASNDNNHEAKVESRSGLRQSNRGGPSTLPGLPDKLLSRTRNQHQFDGTRDTSGTWSDTCRGEPSETSSLSDGLPAPEKSTDQQQFRASRDRSWIESDRGETSEISGVSDGPSTREDSTWDLNWDPAKEHDLTVNLKMDVYEDLTDVLEEFSCLHRLGDFNSARKYFQEHLGDHSHDPYVLAHFGEMLLEQGDYQGIVKLGPFDQNLLFEAEQRFDVDDLRLLHDYWNLIIFYAECHNIPQRASPFTFDGERPLLLREKVMEHGRDLTSIEIRYIALLYQYCGSSCPEVAKHRLHSPLDTMFALPFHEKVHNSLLRQGRIWDLRDIVVARMATESPWAVSASWSTHPDFSVRLHRLFSKWTNQSAKDDTSTLLALLDIFTSLISWDHDRDIVPGVLATATQIARQIMNEHPEAMKTRQFMQWTLAQCENAELGSHVQQLRQEEHLSFLPGFSYKRGGRHLTQYVPFYRESPGWICKDGPSELLNAAAMALSTSTNLADYRIQARTLHLLIFLSANPLEKLEMLGNLQKLSQGDNFNLAETLAAKYLVSSDDASRKKLRDELADQWSIPGLHNYLDSPQLWILSKIRCALAIDDTEAYRAQSDAHSWFMGLPAYFTDLVNAKWPLPRQESQGNTEATRRGRNRHCTFDINTEPRQRPARRTDDQRSTAPTMAPRANSLDRSDRRRSAPSAPPPPPPPRIVQTRVRSNTQSKPFTKSTLQGSPNDSTRPKFSEGVDDFGIAEIDGNETDEDSDTCTGRGKGKDKGKGIDKGMSEEKRRDINESEDEVTIYGNAPPQSRFVLRRRPGSSRLVNRGDSIDIEPPIRPLSRVATMEEVEDAGEGARL